MPFTKIGKNEYESPSGRHYNGAQVRLWYAGGGKFPGEKGPGEVKHAPAKHLLGLHGYAYGGRPEVGTPALVGENGPELFIPDQNGTVIPADPTRQMLLAMDWSKRGTPEYGSPELDRAAGMGLSARGGAAPAERRTPVRGVKSLQRAIEEAEGDEDLLRIKKSLERRGIDTSVISAFEGL